MARPTHILTVRTRDGSPLDVDPVLYALGKSEGSISVYDRHDLSRRLGSSPADSRLR
jgi:hypothetical protein